MSGTPQDITGLSAQEKRKLLEQLLKAKKARRPAAPDCAASRFQYPANYTALKDSFTRVAGPGDIYFNPCEGLNNNQTVIGDRIFINYSSYNYIGMSGDPFVSQAAKDAIERYGTSVSASRIASGERPLHADLEAEIAGLVGTQDAVVFVGGYGTNETVIGHICTPDDIILYDSYIHASVQAGSKLSGATVRPFPHNSWEALDRMLSELRGRYRQALIVLEGVYSMDGDLPDLPRFIEVKKRHAALLMIDEAHSIGVLGSTGAGIGEHYGIDRSDVDLWMGTISKSFASCGGYIAADKNLIEYLKYTAPGFVFSVGMTPPNAAAALAAIRLMRREPRRLEQLRKNALLFLQLTRQAGLHTGTSHDSPVIPVILGNTAACIELYRRLYEHGILALPVIYPAVPENASRLRFFISSLHTREHIERTVETMAAVMPALPAREK